ncbi:uncharacterized protein K441DRAFT_655399 [Cenococcum geophilum 1.58]|uniref:uncharacterized protein n=1 Tax=Cenococcum geophilum 1.58 TaxID=794803 RepID=UPI00358EFBAE|nr:hypothetical protein K441DRAFT_655399 [Cenococcum geophilum 1.58]
MVESVSTPKLTPPPTSSGQGSHSRASSNPSPGYLDSNSKGNGAGSPVLPLNNFRDVENGGNSAHGRGTGEELLHSSRQLISPFEGIQDN